PGGSRGKSAPPPGESERRLRLQSQGSADRLQCGATGLLRRQVSRQVGRRVCAVHLRWASWACGLFLNVPKKARAIEALRCRVPRRASYFLKVLLQRQEGGSVFLQFKAKTPHAAEFGLITRTAGGMLASPFTNMLPPGKLCHDS